MASERFGKIKFKGNDVTVIGDDLRAGVTSPDFVNQTVDWLPFHGLADTKGKVRIIAAVPSLETEVCDRETRRFNLEATILDKDIVILVISMDLPYTQKRWCGAAGIDRVITLSDHMAGEFGEKFGCLIKDVRVLRRAIFVVNRENKIVYSAYMPTLGDEPDYNLVLEAAKSVL